MKSSPQRPTHPTYSLTRSLVLSIVPICLAIHVIIILDQDLTEVEYMLMQPAVMRF